MDLQESWHKTESVYRRYAIVAEADLREGVAKLVKLHESQVVAAASSPTVIPLSSRRPRLAEKRQQSAESR